MGKFSTPIFPTPFKTILIDDEKLAISRLERLLAKYENTFEIIGRAINGDEGLSIVETLRPDLIFLDIEMPVMTGFEMLSRLTYLPLVVFATAYDEYAIKAFEERRKKSCSVLLHSRRHFIKRRLRHATWVVERSQHVRHDG